jgi:hypothetical protein
MQTAMLPSFPQSTRDAIRERIRRYPELSRGFEGFDQEVRRYNGLPIAYDMWVAIFLTPDGELFALDMIGPEAERLPIRMLWQQLVYLNMATEYFPELAAALPARPSDAIDCPDCAGRGSIDNRTASGSGSATWPCRHCGAMGWRASAQPLYP